MRLRLETLSLLEAMLARPLRTPPLTVEEIGALQPEIVRQGALADLREIVESCQVMRDGVYSLGYRLIDRDEARAFVAHLRELPARASRRGRVSPLGA